jgi:NAD(P)H-flavin reductase
MIATGTGIAPFRSMLVGMFESGNGIPDAMERPASPPVNPSAQFWLLFGARYEQDIYYREEFERLAAEHSNFHFMPTLSRGGPEWKGLRGYVQEHVREIVGSRTDMQAYICGLDKMVSANRKLLRSLGWDRKSIRYEKYD